MGFYIEELPTEFNGITMQEADYLADEFLKDTPCNRMWDAMRALRDFYETVTSEAVDLADRKTENSSEIPNNCEDCKHNKLEWYSEICDSCCGNNNHYEPKEEPQYDAEEVAKDINRRVDMVKNEWNARHIEDEPTISKMEQVDKDINVRSKDEPMRTTDYCDICKRDMCEFCTADNTNPYCVPSHYEIKQDEPQTNADQHVQHVESVEPTWTKEDHEAFYTFLWNVINPNEMQDYIGMFETKDEPQTERSK